MSIQCAAAASRSLRRATERSKIINVLTAITLQPSRSTPGFTLHRRRNYSSTTHRNRSTTPGHIYITPTPRLRRFSTTPRRSIIFDFVRPSEERQLRDPVIGAGMATMLDLRRKTRLQSRLPSSKLLGAAVGQFLNMIDKQEIPVEDVRVQYLLDAVRVVADDYDHFSELQSQKTNERPKGVDGYHFSIPQIRLALKVLSREPRGDATLHGTLALELVEHADKLVSADGNLGRSLDEGMVADLVTILGFSGQHDVAVKLVRSLPSADDGDDPLQYQPAWFALCKGLMRGTNNRLTLSIARDMQASTSALTAEQVSELVEAAPSSNVVMGLCEGPLNTFSNGELELVQASILTAALRLTRRSGKPFNPDGMGHRAFMSTQPTSVRTQSMATAMLSWATIAFQCPETVSNLVDTFSTRKTADGVSLLTTDTVNDVMDAAVQFQSWGTAKQLLDLARSRNGEISSNVRTSLILAQECITAPDKNITQAMRHLEDAVRMENETGEPIASTEIGPILNHLLVLELDQATAGASAATKKLTDIDAERVSTILNLVEDLGARNCAFSIATVTKLAIFHIRRDEIYDTIDLLRTHAFTFSSAERQGLLSALIEVVEDPTVSTATAWDTYTVIEETFGTESGPAELTLGPDIRLMNAFFARSRADMACLVFGHVVKLASTGRWNSAFEASLSNSFVTLFTGIAQTADPAALDYAYSHLKLDTSANLTTRLLNAVMLAHAACAVSPPEPAPADAQPETENGDGGTEAEGYAPSDDVGIGSGPARGHYALDVFRKIVERRAGPSHSSIVIALWACEQLAIASGTDMPGGTARAVRQALTIWKIVTRLVSERAGGDTVDMLGEGVDMASWEEQVLAGVSAALGAGGEIEVVKALLKKQGAQYVAVSGVPNDSHHVHSGGGGLANFGMPIPGAASSSSASTGETTPNFDLDVLPDAPVTPNVLAAFFNAVQSPEEQRRLLLWFSSRFPSQLNEMKARGGGRDGKRAYFQVKRVLVP